MNLTDRHRYVACWASFGSTAPCTRRSLPFTPITPITCAGRVTGVGAVADRLRAMATVETGHDPAPSASIVDARSVRGASTVTSRPGEMTPGRRSRVARRSVSSIRSACSSPWSWWLRRRRTTRVASPCLTRVGPRRGGSRSCGATAVSRTPFVRHCQRRGVEAEVVRIHPHAFVARPQALDRRAHRFLAHEQPPTPGRL